MPGLRAAREGLAGICGPHGDLVSCGLTMPIVPSSAKADDPVPEQPEINCEAAAYWILALAGASAILGEAWLLRTHVTNEKPPTFILSANHAACGRRRGPRHRGSDARYRRRRRPFGQPGVPASPASAGNRSRRCRDHRWLARVQFRRRALPPIRSR